MSGRSPLPTLLDVERAISELRHAQAKLEDSDRWARERAQSLERVLCWLELELGPLVAELGVPIAAQASSTEVPPVEGIRRVLLERVGLESRRDFTPSDLGELGGTTGVVVDVPAGVQFDRVYTNRSNVAVSFSAGVAGTVAPPALELAERLHELGEVTPEEGQAISGRDVCACGHRRTEHEPWTDGESACVHEGCACGLFR